MDKNKRLPRQLALIRDGLIHYTKQKRDDLTLEQIAMIFRINKGTVHQVLEKKVDDIKLN